MSGFQEHNWLVFSKRNQFANTYFFRWGLNDEVKGQATKMATEGFCCLLPDLYRGSAASEVDHVRSLIHIYMQECLWCACTGLYCCTIPHVCWGFRQKQTAVDFKLFAFAFNPEGFLEFKTLPMVGCTFFWCWIIHKVIYYSITVIQGCEKVYSLFLSSPVVYFGIKGMGWEYF